MAAILKGHNRASAAVKQEPALSSVSHHIKVQAASGYVCELKCHAASGTEHDLLGCLQGEQERLLRGELTEEELITAAAEAAIKDAAALKWLEESDEAKRMNQMMLHSQCMAIRWVLAIILSPSLIRDTYVAPRIRKIVTFSITHCITGAEPSRFSFPAVLP